MIPKLWDDLINDEWIVDDEVIGRALTAAPDLARLRRQLEYARRLRGHFRFGR